MGALSNIVLSAVKITAGWLGQSHALIADGVHSLSDLASDALVWTAGRKSGQAPDDQHPYGHGRYETLATLALGALLIIVAIGIAWDAIGRLFSPEALLTPQPMTLYAALASIVVKEWLYWYTLAHAKRVRSDMLRANAWHHRSDALSSAIVLLGILFGKRFWWIDSVLGVLISLMLIYAVFEIVKNSIEKLLGAKPDKELIAAVNKLISEVSDREICPHHFHLHTYGDHQELTFHIMLKGDLDIDTGHDIATNIELALRDQMGIEATIHVEPIRGNQE